MIKKKTEQKRGQAMLLAVLALGGTMLGATTIAGFLMLYQIRQATDFENSSRAIFAADAGTEWALYSYLHGVQLPSTTFSNGASVEVTCYESDNTTPTPCYSTSTAVTGISKGTAGDTKRAFAISFNGAMTTLP